MFKFLVYVFVYMVEFVQKPVTQFDILPEQIKDRHVPTGEIHGSKIVAYSIPSDRIPTGAIKNWHIADGEVKDRHIPTGEVHGSKLQTYSIPSDRIPTSAIKTWHIEDAAIILEEII